MKKSFLYLSILILTILIVFSGCSKIVERRKILFLFGNVNTEIMIYADKNFNFDQVFEQVEDTLKKLDSYFSKFDQNSFVYKFNNSFEKIKPEKEFLEMLFLSDSLKELTGGYFNIFIEPLLAYYRRCEKEQKKILKDSIQFYVKLINLKKPYTVEEGYIKKTTQKVSLDFGGIAKGFFGDIVVSLLKSYGVKKALINIGGDIVCYNELDKNYFKIGVRSFQKDSIVRVDSILNGSIVTSGDYFRFYTIGKEKYSHIINPKNGEPSFLVHSLTLKSSRGAIADALATAFMLMDYKDIDNVIKKIGDVEIFIQR